MSDRSPEDEMIYQARQFSASMQAAMRHYAQASNWLERRQARREISLITRQEARGQQAARQRHLGYTEQAVDRYRAHALAVSQRANDPTVDHERRFRDAQALARHRNDMAERVLRNPHLTQVEQGVALDGLDAATAFPEFETNGRLFARTNRVKGIEALRYRAQVARAMRTAGIERPAMFTAPAHVVQQRPQVLARVEWSDPDRRITGRTAEKFESVEQAKRWMRDDLSQSDFSPGESVRVEAYWTNDATRPQYRDQGRPDAVFQRLRADVEHFHDRDRAARGERLPFGEPDRSGRPAAVRPQNRAAETATQHIDPAQQLQVKATVSRWAPGMPTVEQDRMFAEEQEAIDWLHRDITESQWAPDARVGVEVVDLTDIREPIYSDEGRPVTVAGTLKARSTELRDHGKARNHDRVDPWSAEHERDQARTELQSLKDRHRLSIQHNNQLVNRNAALVKQLTTLTAERDQWRDEYAKDTADDARLEAERSQLRETNSRLTAKLDQALAERDAAVQKLAEMTPEHERYGSAERQATQARVEAEHPAEPVGTPSTDRQPIPGHAFAGLVNGRDREQEMER